MNNLWKRSLSLLLALVMVVGMFPMGIKAKAVNADSPLIDAQGIIWLVKNGDDASDEFINKISALKLDDMIREAVGEKNKSAVVEYVDKSGKGIDVGSYAGLYMGGEELKDELVNAVKERKLILFRVGGVNKWIAFRELIDAEIVIGEGNQIVIENAGKPGNLDELVNNALNNPQIAISEGGSPANLELTDHKVSVQKDNYHWPVAGEGDVPAGTVTVTIYADDKESEFVTQTAQVILRDTRKVLTLEFYDRGEKLDSYKAYADEATLLKAPTRQYYRFDGWSERSKDAETGLCIYDATWKPVNDEDDDGVANEEEVFTIIYKVNGEVFRIFEDVKWGDYTPMPETNPEDTGSSKFAGWGKVEQRVYADAVYEAVFTQLQIVTVNARYQTTHRVFVFYVGEDGYAVNPPAFGEIEPYYCTGLYYTDVNGVKHTIDNLKTFKFSKNITELKIEYYTDADGNRIEDGTKLNPYYYYAFVDVNGEPIHRYKANDNDLYLTERTLKEVLKQAPAYKPQDLVAGGWSGFELDTKNSDEGHFYYIIRPVDLKADQNNNNIPDDDEKDKLVVTQNWDPNITFDVTYDYNVATVECKVGKDTYRGTVTIPGLLQDGTFKYDSAKTSITATPLRLVTGTADRKATTMFYVDSLTINGDDTGVYYADLNACKDASEVATASETGNVIVKVTYAQIQMDKAIEDDEYLKPGKPSYTVKEVYEEAVSTPAYPTSAEFEADKTLGVTVEYLARPANTSVTVDLNGLYDSLADLIPEDYMKMAKDYVGEEITVTLGEKWLPVAEAPAKEESAQAIADEFFQTLIDELETNGFDQDAMADKIFTMKDDLKAELEERAAVHKFGVVYPDGDPESIDRTVEFVDVTYQNEKVYLNKKNVPIFILDTRTPVYLEAKGDLTKGYRCFTDADLLDNIVVKNARTHEEIKGLTLELARSYENSAVGKHKITVSFAGDEDYSGGSICFWLTVTKVKPIVTVPHTVYHALNGVIKYEDVKATVSPSSATIFHVIAGMEAEELSFDSDMQLKDEEIVLKAWLKLPAMYISLVNGLEVEGKKIKTGEFLSVEELEDLLDKYASTPDAKFVKEINKIRGLIDMIPDRVINRLGLEDRTYTLQVRLDSFEDTTYPTKPGMYVNFAASTAYLGDVLPDPYGSMFKNDNYEVAKMPTGTDDLGKIKNMSADGGIIVISPMVPVPNSGGIQIYDSQVSNAPNVFIYEYDGNPVNVNLEVALNGEKLEGAEPFYYGVSTRLDLKQSAPTMPGVYMAGYNHFTTEYNESTQEEEIRRLGSDSCLIIIKQRAADLSITGGIFEFDGETHHPEIVVTDKHGNKIPHAGMTIISGTVNVNTDGTNVTANDLFGAVNIDFPAGLTIPYLPDGTPYNMDEAWAHYRAKVLNKAENDKVTPSDVIAFLEFCGEKATNGANKALDKFQSMRIAEAVNKILDKLGKDSKNIDGKVEAGQIKMNNAKVYFDRLIDELRPLEKLDDNVWITFYDLEKLDYSATGAYLYLGMVTDPDLAVVSADGSVRDPDLTVGAATGLVIIHSADDYVMYDTHVPYNGKPQNIFEVDNTGREDVTVILDRTDDAAVAVDTYNKIVHIQVDEKIAQAIIDELNKIPHVELTLESGVYVGTIYEKGEDYAARLTDRIIREVREHAVARISKDYPVVDEAYNKAMSMLDEKLSALTARLSNKLQVLDHMENGTRIVINGKLPVDLGTYEVTRFNFNVSEVNILLDADVLGAVKAALEEAGYKVTLNDGADGYVVTGYEKVGDVSEVIINKVFRKIESVGTKKIVKTAVESGEELLDKLGRGEIDIDAKTQAALDLMNAKLLVWKNRILAKMQAVDNVDSYTRVVLNGTLPVDAGTYEFYGYDYDVSATRGTLVIEPIYIVVEDNYNSKMYGEADPELTANVSYYSYSGVAPSAVERVEIINLPNGLTAADLVSYKVVRADAGTEEGEKIGLHDLTVTDLTLLNESGNFKLGVCGEDTQDFEIIPEMGTIADGKWTMSLDEVIYLNYYPVFEGWSDGYDFEKFGGVVVWVDDVDTPTPALSSQLTIGAENTVTLPMFYNEEKGEYYVKTSEIFAKNIGDMIYIRPFVRSASDPDNLDMVVYLEKAKGYSPARFCYDVLNDSREGELRQLACAALLEYGTSAQMYFDYNEAKPANVVPAKWPAAKQMLAQYKADGALDFKDSYLNGLYRDKHIEDLVATMSGTNFKDIINAGKTLDLQGAIRLSVAFNLEKIDWNNVEYAKVMFWSQSTIMGTNDLSYEGKTYDYICDLVPEAPDADVKLGDYRAKSHHIRAKNLGDSVYYYCVIKMKDSDDIHRSGLIIYSPERSVYDHLKDSGNVNNVDEVCRRIAVYSEMARRLFGWNLNE